ncbi:hypothetical protein EIP86_002864 [Pleurotus ostreatoroseus]|nr:hypothetical protein EIP86_002864 [Pleurotus ostreatoroseus]
MAGITTHEIQNPTPREYFEPAHELSSRIICHLWKNWGADEGGIRNGEIDLYNVNIPMIEDLLADDGMPICWTRIWRNSYGRLFAPHTAHVEVPPPAGPDAPEESATDAEKAEREKEAQAPTPALSFKFAPDVSGLIRPTLANVPVGSDGWAIAKGYASVTPMRASFAEPEHEILESALEDVEQLIWKVKLRPPAPTNMPAYTHSQSTTLDTLNNRDADAPLVLFEGRVRVTFL